MAVTIGKPFISQNIQNSAFVYGHGGTSSQKSYNSNISDQSIKKTPKGSGDFSAQSNNFNTSDTTTNTENKNDSTEQKDKTADSGPPETKGLTEKELRILESLKARDNKVRRHEMAHIAAGGQYITSGAHYQYEKGPDGNNYAVAGDVSIDTSPVPGDPEATIAKMHKVEQAALAPAEPSAQDKKVAAESAFVAAKALSELMIMQTKQRTETGKHQFQSYQQSPKSAVKAYEKAGMEPVQKGTGFDIAA